MDQPPRWTEFPSAGGLQYNGSGDHSGAQTERRGGAGPVRGLLGGKDPTSRILRGAESAVSLYRRRWRFGTLCLSGRGNPTLGRRKVVVLDRFLAPGDWTTLV
jgi:hypothetical protein